MGNQAVDGLAPSQKTQTDSEQINLLVKGGDYYLSERVPTLSFFL